MEPEENTTVPEPTKEWTPTQILVDYAEQQYKAGKCLQGDELVAELAKAKNKNQD